jgi:AmmeMemoRadiSam system protein B
MNLFNLVVVPFFVFLFYYGCNSAEAQRASDSSVRQLVDTVGFARYSWQMDSLMSRLDRAGWKKTEGMPWKMVICPHDDYTYVGTLYPEILSNIKADNLIIIGVAHKAQRLGIEDSLVFGSFTAWKGPWGNVPVSSADQELFGQLKNKCAILSDTLHKVEHSLEALVPFLQYFNRNISIVPILVPSMSPERMKECGSYLSKAIRSVAERHKWSWGLDYAIIVTTDAVHYGNEDWGGADYAYYGCDDSGNALAMNHENEILSRCFSGELAPEKISLISQYTLDSSDFHNYKWTWCGRYSLPVAMYTTYFLSFPKPLAGEVVGYSTSITGKHIPVDDLRMGRTAIAAKCHWVGYAAVGFRLSGF